MSPYGSVAYSVSSFEVDGDRAWLAAWNKGLYLQQDFLIDTAKLPSQKMVVKMNDEIQSVCSWNKNYVLAGSKSTGLYVVNKNNFSSLNLRHDRGDNFSIASNKVNCIYKDRNGILWVGTSGGISKYNPVTWQFHATPLSASDENEFTHFSTHEDSDGTIRVCTSAGIFKKKPDEHSFHLVNFEYEHKPVSPTYIFSYNGEVFLCTEDFVYHYDVDRESINKVCSRIYYPNRGILNFTNQIQVRSAFADTIDGHVVFILGVLGDGFGVYHPDSCTLGLMVYAATNPSRIRNNLIHYVLKDHQKNIWVATAGGLFRWKKSFPQKNDFVAYQNNPHDASTISGDNISGIYADEQNHLWITTLGNGLNEFDGKKFLHYKVQTSAGNNMLGIYADHNHHYWIPTPQGFEVFDASTKKFDDVPVTNPEWILKYPTRMVIQKDGAFSYGAGNYFITFYPDSFQFETTTQKISL